MLRYFLALLLIQAVPLSPPPQPVPLPHPRRLHVTETMHQTPIPTIWPAPTIPQPDELFFDGPARAAGVFLIPGGYRVIVMRRNGQHVSQDYAGERASLEMELK